MTSARGQAGAAAQLEAFQTIIRKLEELAAGQRELRRTQEEQGGELREVRRLMPRKRRGAPPTYDWVPVRRVIWRHANQKQTRLETRTEIRKLAMEVVETWRDQPDDRTIWNFVNQMAEDFGIDEG